VPISTISSSLEDVHPIEPIILLTSAVETRPPPLIVFANKTEPFEHFRNEFEPTN
jgi:hypothetical protein